MTSNGLIVFLYAGADEPFRRALAPEGCGAQGRLRRMVRGGKRQRASEVPKSPPKVAPGRKSEAGFGNPTDPSALPERGS